MTATSPRTIQVLAVDDDQSFVELTARRLEGELDYDEVDVVTETDAETALDRVGNEVDCIVSDYQMPGTDGLEFLDAVRERRPELPFILFTGKGSEEIASEAIAAGVTNYVQKNPGSDQYVVLANRIETAVEGYRARQARNAAEQRYTHLVEQTPHAIAVCRDTEIVYANDAFADLLNAGGREDVIGLTPGDVVHPDYQEEYLTQVERIRSQGSVDWFQGEIRDFDGKSRLVETTGAPVTYNGGDAVQLIFRDITERARREDELEQVTERFRSVFENSQDPMLILDPEEGVFHDANPRACELLGYDRDELLSLSPEDIHPHDLDEFRTFMESVVTEGKGWTRDLSCYTNDESMVPVEVSASVIGANGDRRVLAVLRDLSARRTREHQLRQLQEVATELLAAESRTEVERIAVDAVEEILDLPYAGFHRFDPETEVLEPTAVAPAIEEVFDGDVPSIGPGDDSLAWDTYASGESRVVQDLEEGGSDLAAGTAIESAIQFPVGDDGLLLVGAPATNAFDPAEIDLTRLLAATVDAALDRLARERELVLKNRAMDEADIGITITDSTRPDNPIVYANEGFEQLTGYDREDIIGGNHRFLQGEETDPGTVATMREAIDAEEPVSVDVLNYREDGTPFWNQVEITPVRDDDGTVTHFLGFQRDVTDRKEREQRIQTQKRRLDTVLENVPVVLWEIDEDGVFTTSEGEALRKLGLEPGAVVGESVFEVFADQPEVLDQCERALDGESISTTDTVDGESISSTETDDDVVFESWYQPIHGDDDDVTGVVGLSYDITERKHQERKQKRIIDRMTDAIAKVDADWEFTLVDRRAEEALGTDRQALLGQQLWDVFADAQDTRFEEEYREVMKTRDPASFEAYYGGLDRWFHVNAYPDDDGGLSFYFRDITDRKEREQMIERRNDLFRKAQEIADVGAWTYDVRTGENDWTEEVYRIYDLDEEFDPVPEEGIEFYHPDDRPVIREKFENAIERGESYDIEVRLITADDELRWVRTQGDPRVEDGEVIQVRGTIQDITHRKERERELRRLKERFQAVFRQSSDAIMVVDVDAEEFVEVNEAAREMLGYSREELLGLRPEEIHPDDTDGVREEFLAEVHETGSGWTDELPCVTKDGEEIPTEISGAPLRIDEEQSSKMVAILRDVSDRVAYERELERQKRALERQNERLENFASVVSHDLRNPLSLAEGYLKILRETDDEDVLDEMEAAHERMRTIINDVLTVAREGQAVEEVEPVDLRELLEAAWEGVETGDAKIRIEGTPGEAMGDEDRLRRVFENLFRNAIDHAGVDATVTVGCLPDGDGIYVADDGPGIPAPEREDVFEWGYSTADDGTGYGLAIVNDLVEAHDWTVTAAESDAGGARFEITGIDTSRVAPDRNPVSR